jgi:hypothetical protein
VELDVLVVFDAAFKISVVFALVSVKLDILFIDGVAVNISVVFVLAWVEFASANW